MMSRQAKPYKIEIPISQFTLTDLILWPWVTR